MPALGSKAVLVLPDPLEWTLPKSLVAYIAAEEMFSITPRTDRSLELWNR